MILVVCGPPGAGKSTVATGLCERLRAADREVSLLHSDDFSRRTYERMYDRVRDDHRADWILDGTFYRREYQDRFRALSDVHLVYVTASIETCLERNRQRADSIAEAGVRAMHAKFEEPTGPDLTLDTEQVSPEEAVEAVLRYLRTWGDE